MSYVRVEVFTAVKMMMFFWVLRPCKLVGRCHRFGETYCLHSALKMETVGFSRTQKNIIVMRNALGGRVSNPCTGISYIGLCPIQWIIVVLCHVLGSCVATLPKTFVRKVSVSRPRLIWKNNIKMNFENIQSEGVDYCGIEWRFL
jgi:hypothetical protein